MHDQKILILDFGSQVTQLIARRVRESGVYSEIMPFNADPARIAAFGASGIILSGGPASVADAGSPRAPDYVFSAGVPVLGICYGQMTMCAQLGGDVKGADIREFGRAHVEIVEDCALFEGAWSVGAREQVWMSHGDHISAPPPGFRTVAVSEGAPFAVIADDARRFYGLMFHPEVVHTPHGAQLLRNFTHKVCGLSGDWTMAGFRQGDLRAVRRGGFLSGGSTHP
jgi:GMP synthase (glutamine-hydrolysing)